MRQLREFVDDFRENWDDSYWWLDHQALRMGLLCVLSGVIGLFFLYLRLRLEAKLSPSPQEAP